MLTPDEVTKLSELARIELSDEEKQTASGEIEAILSYVSEVSSLPHKPEGRELNPVRNVLRGDTDPHEPGLYTEALLKNAPAREGSYLRVKKIL